MKPHCGVALFIVRPLRAFRGPQKNNDSDEMAPLKCSSKFLFTFFFSSITQSAPPPHIHPNQLLIFRLMNTVLKSIRRHLCDTHSIRKHAQNLRQLPNANGFNVISLGGDCNNRSNDVCSMIASSERDFFSTDNLHCGLLGETMFHIVQ